MLKTYEKLNVIDVNNIPTGLVAEVNWDERNQATNDCKVIKFTFPDGKHRYVKKEQLLAFLWVIGSPEEQKEMIPQKIQRVSSYETILEIQAKKDIRKGEKIQVRAKINMPTVEEEIIGKYNKNKNIIKV